MNQMDDLLRELSVAGGNANRDVAISARRRIEEIQRQSSQPEPAQLPDGFRVDTNRGIGGITSSKVTSTKLSDGTRIHALSQIIRSHASLVQTIAIDHR